MSTSSKQDRQGSRTPADVERRMSGYKASFAEVMGIALDAQQHSDEALEVAKKAHNAVAEIKKQTDNNKSSIELLVENGEVKGSVIVEAINNDKSTVRLTGDRLVVDSTNFKVTEEGDVSIDGEVTARSGWIGKCAIIDGTLTLGVTYVETFSDLPDALSTSEDDVFYVKSLNSFFRFDWELGEWVMNVPSISDEFVIDSPNFKVKPDGEINSTKGKIGGFDIDEEQITSSTKGVFGEQYTTNFNPSALEYEVVTSGKKISSRITPYGIVLRKENCVGTGKVCFLTIYLSETTGIELYVDFKGNISTAPFGGISQI